MSKWHLSLFWKSLILCLTFKKCTVETVPTLICLDQGKGVSWERCRHCCWWLKTFSSCTFGQDNISTWFEKGNDCKYLANPLNASEACIHMHFLPARKKLKTVERYTGDFRSNFSNVSYKKTILTRITLFVFSTTFENVQWRKRGLPDFCL